MTYCNKNKQGFTALYITYSRKNYDNNAINGGIASNSFHCHIIGRWMEDHV
jgi:hypothetical protein